MHDPLHEEQQSTEQVFDGKLLHVFRDEVRLPDGRTGLREYGRHPGAGGGQQRVGGDGGVEAHAGGQVRWRGLSPGR